MNKAKDQFIAVLRLIETNGGYLKLHGHQGPVIEEGNLICSTANSEREMVWSVEGFEFDPVDIKTIVLTNCECSCEYCYIYDIYMRKAQNE